MFVRKREIMRRGKGAGVRQTEDEGENNMRQRRNREKNRTRPVAKAEKAFGTLTQSLGSI